MRKNNYARAKEVLKANRDVVMLKYYNTYKNYHALKVFFFVPLEFVIGKRNKTTFARAERARQQIRSVRRHLAALADYSHDTPRGGDVFGFKK